MSEVSLTAARSARGPKPTYKPAVEALEVRLVLNGSMPTETLAPSDHTTSPQPLLSPADTVAIGIIKGQIELAKKIIQDANSDRLDYNVQLLAHRLAQVKKLNRLFHETVGSDVDPGLANVFDDFTAALRRGLGKGFLGGRPGATLNRTTGEALNFLTILSNIVESGKVTGNAIAGRNVSPDR